MIKTEYVVKFYLYEYGNHGGSGWYEKEFTNPNDAIEYLNDVREICLKKSSHIRNEGHSNKFAEEYEDFDGYLVKFEDGVFVRVITEDKIIAR